ncbi:hypothetical protein BG011_009452 [Mortierella polycephala]|uniref:RhoGAP-domain-containing protein n=1 Tax=Mortierella polycephala TaxID=41804 RepID=A0A9P6TWJ1_9FUNG|nr:hypothetical protein BG011_009452 [Mortierella polycephala]
MTGDEAYHADCFRCIQCESKIDDLVFAKTSQGIYCMRCHQERKEAKRQREERERVERERVERERMERERMERERVERERVERAERMMDKLLPTIPESEKRLAPEPQRPHLPHLPNSTHSNHSTHSARSNHSSGHNSVNVNVNNNQYPAFGDGSDHPEPQNPGMPKLPFQMNLRPDYNGVPKTNRVSPSPRTDSRPKGSNGLPSVNVGPPFLPPLSFGFDDTSSSGFDLGEMLSGSEKDNKENNSVNTPTPLVKDAEIISSLQVSSFRTSVGKAGFRISKVLAEPSSLSSTVDETRSSLDSHEPVLSTTSDDASDRPVDSIPDSSHGLVEHDTTRLAEAEDMIRELRMELAKHNPMSALLHGTPQQEYGLLLKKTKKLTQEHAELEKSIRDMYIEKDMLCMDLEAMNEELKVKEDNLTVSNNDKLQVAPTPNPRMSTNHEFMKQAYLVEVKALQEQKERLQQDIQIFVEQRDGVLNEMQILSVRNAELSTMNNDMMRELQGRSDMKPTSATNNGMLQSFTDKIRRQRQLSGGNQHDLRTGHLLGSNESTHSFNSTLSDENIRSRHAGEHASSKSRREERQEDIFGEEIATPKKFNWKKGTTNTVKSVGAMFGKLLVEAPSSNLEVPGSKGGQLFSDSASFNGQILPPTRSFTGNSETRSLNGRSTEQHYFIQHNFVRPCRCECCEEKVWGREYRCRNCGFQVHGKCTQEIMPGCSGHLKDSDSSSLRNVTSSGGSASDVPPPPPAKQIMFGNDLLDQLEFEQRTVPLVVEKCIEAVDERGLDVEGIYRRSGMAAEARQLVQAYDIGLQPDLMDSDIYQDICSITSVLKQYLRSLPQPLIPFDLYADFIESISLPHNEVKMQTFRDLLDRMPLAYYTTLKVLLEHLTRVRRHDNINLMNAKNLSVVFGPTLMRNPDPSKEIMDMTYKNMAIEFIITHSEELFIRQHPSTSSATASGRPSTSSAHERPSTSSTHERPSTSSTHERPSISSTNTTMSAMSNGSSSQQQQRHGVNGGTGLPSPPPRRIANAGSPPSSGLAANPPTHPTRTNSGDTVPTGLTGLPQALQPQQTYQPTSQYRPQPYQPQPHQTIQQLHQKQQQLQLLQHQQQQQQQPPQTIPASGATAAAVPPVTSAPSYALHHHNYAPTPQQQQANPEVDMTHFP